MSERRGTEGNIGQDNPAIAAVAWPSARVDVLYEVLKEHILNQHWPPGAQLNISKLAQDFRVSITPVREALSRLTTERLIVYESNHGFRIAPLPSTRRMQELGEMRLVLEVHAAEAAAVRRTEADLDLLRSTQRDLAEIETNTKNEQVWRFASANRLFHQRIIEASGNSVLAELYTHLGYHVVTGHVFQTRGIFGLAAVIEEHAAVIDALESGEPDRAKEAIRQHVKTAHQRVMDAYPAIE